MTKNENDLEIIENKIYLKPPLGIANKETEIRFGGKCIKCDSGLFDYDGMLNLVCSNCGYTSGGCFTW